MVVAEFAGEMTVGLLQLQHVIQQGPHPLFPLAVLPAVPLFVGQIVEPGIDSLRLFATAVNHIRVGGNTIGYAHLVFQPPFGGESMLQPTVEDGLSGLYQALLAGLLTIFQRIEGIEQHTATETQLNMVDGQTVVAPDGESRMVF